MQSKFIINRTPLLFTADLFVAVLNWIACAVIGYQFGAPIGIVLLILFEARAALATLVGMSKARGK